MDYTRVAQFQQNPNPNPNFAPAGYFPNSDPYQQQQGYYQHNDPHNNALIQAQPPPGVDPPYVPPPVTVNYDHQSVPFQPQQSVDAGGAPAGFQWDPNPGYAAALAQYAATSYAAGVSVPTPTIRPHINHNRKKAPKKTKIVQSAWCEVCKIDCNSKDVLDQHKLGKKHKKNIEKLKGPPAPAPAPAPTLAPAPAPAVVSLPPAIASTSMPFPVSSSTPIDKPVIGPEENPDKATLSSAQKARKKAAVARTEDIDTKKRKVLDGGAAAEAVRTCVICNVVCNSQTVFNYHLAGQKHASMVKKQASNIGVAPVV